MAKHSCFKANIEVLGAGCANTWKFHFGGIPEIMACANGLINYAGVTFFGSRVLWVHMGAREMLLEEAYIFHRVTRQ
jgi:hypothetical protein